MKRILMLCLLFASICCFGQDVQFDLLFDKRQKYSSKKSFNEYCKVMYIQYKENSPPPPPPSTPSLKKMFNIPYYERLKLYPFNEFDSITLILNNSDTLVLDSRIKKKLTNTVYNFSYTSYSGLIYSFTNYKDEVRCEFIFVNSTSNNKKYLKLYNLNSIETNFSKFELSQFDIDTYKIDKWLKEIKKGSR